MEYDKSGIYPFKIKSYEADYNGKMNLNACFLFLQESAWQNALDNGFGYEYLEKENAYWVLTRVIIQIENWPKWKDEIHVRTWPRTADGLFALRDYQIIFNNEVFASVGSSWLVLDKDTKRPRRISDFIFSSSEFTNEKALNKSLSKVGLPNEMKKLDSRKVYISDIDVNGHVNNATYVKWISDALYQINANEIKEFEINFIRELMLDDEFSVYLGNQNGEYICQIVSQENKEICRSRIKY